jgi:Tfp pilus assembly protein PilE
LSKAFTLVEVVVAFALSAALVVAVYSATQAITTSATRQKAAATEVARWRRFEEILRRDVRGWIAVRSSTTPPANPGTNAKQSEKPGDSAHVELLNFTTSADSLSAEPEAARAIVLRYILQGTEGDFALIRIESQPAQSTDSESTPVQTIICRCSRKPKVEFFDGTRWRDINPPKLRPTALKFTIDDRTIFIKP